MEHMNLKRILWLILAYATERKVLLQEIIQLSVWILSQKFNSEKCIKNMGSLHSFFKQQFEIRPNQQNWIEPMSYKHFIIQLMHKYIVRRYN